MPLVHVLIALIIGLAMTALYQWLRADSAIGYADGLWMKLRVAQHDIKQLEEKVTTLQLQIDELRGLH